MVEMLRYPPDIRNRAGRPSSARRACRLVSTVTLGEDARMGDPNLPQSPAEPVRWRGPLPRPIDNRAAQSRLHLGDLPVGGIEIAASACPPSGQGPLRSRQA